MSDLLTVLKKLLRDVCQFAADASGLQLRQYQQQVARSIVESVLKKKGLTFVVLFPRQSGKNELQAQIEAYLLTLLSKTDAEIVKVSPTWKPQSLNAMRRLQRVLDRNLLARGMWNKEAGYIYKMGSARIFFFSGSPTSNIVGATASTLLECDEAQDVLVSKWDKDINPMAASTNATRVFWGTAWTSQTLLAREKRAALNAQQADGEQRVFQLTADDVAREVPAYGDFVKAEIAKLGRNHPIIRTQFFSEEIDAEGGMFPPARLALMQGDHSRQHSPTPGRIYAFLVDVAGEDEGASLDSSSLNNEARDSTALTIVEIDLSSLNDELINAPTYKVVDRRIWTGDKHTSLYGQIVALDNLWSPRYMVIDATGVGAGLASFLAKSMGERLIPFTFNAATKSRLGWDFLSVIETGRFQDWKPAPWVLDESSLFKAQLAACQMEILPGPDRRMRWSVPDGSRNADGELVHDDLILSAALCAVLDEQAWGRAESLVIAAADPLANTGEVF